MICDHVPNSSIDSIKIHREDAPLKQCDIGCISSLINTANDIIQEHGQGMSAEDTMKLLNMYSSRLKSYSTADGARKRADSYDSLASDASSDLGNLTFTYEEESDP